MRLFGKQRKEERPRREPSQVAEIVPGSGIVAQIWSADREGGQRIDWSIARARRESDPEGVPYRTFRPRDLPACAKTLATLSKGFAECSLIDSGTRARLALLSALLLEALADFAESEKKVAEESEENGQTAAVLKFG